ncbi:hypothetical protein GCM10023096_01550 [Nonomuraea ferruginea]
MGQMRWVHKPRHYGVGQLIMSFFFFLVALLLMTSGWSLVLSRTLSILMFGCVVAGPVFMFSAGIPRRTP